MSRRNGIALVINFGHLYVMKNAKLAYRLGIPNVIESISLGTNEEVASLLFSESKKILQKRFYDVRRDRRTWRNATRNMVSSFGCALYRGQKIYKDYSWHTSNTPEKPHKAPDGTGLISGPTELANMMKNFKLRKDSGHNVNGWTVVFFVGMFYAGILEEGAQGIGKLHAVPNTAGSGMTRKKSNRRIRNNVRYRILSFMLTDAERLIRKYGDIGYAYCYNLYNDKEL